MYATDRKTCISIKYIDLLLFMYLFIRERGYTLPGAVLLTTVEDVFHSGLCMYFRNAFFAILHNSSLSMTIYCICKADSTTDISAQDLKELFHVFVKYSPCRKILQTKLVELNSVYILYHVASIFLQKIGDG
jgi:hypothetical protein